MPNTVGLQQLTRTQGIEWGDSVNDTHLWIADHVIYTDAALNLAALSFGSLTLTDASSEIIPGTASLLFRNHADTFTNMSISDTGIIAITPQDATVSSPMITIGALTNTTNVATNSATVNWGYVRQSFTGAGYGAASGNSARLWVTEAHWTDNTDSVGTLAGSYNFAYHDGSGSDVGDLFGTIGRAYITSTGTCSVGFWGTRGDINFSGAGSAVSAVCVYAHAGDQFAGSSITTWSGLKVDQINWNVTTVQDAYGALIGAPAGATGHKIGVSIGPPLLAGTSYTQGLVVWGAGATIKGGGTVPLADTSSSQTLLFIQSGSNSGANDVNCLIYFYRSSVNQGYIGFDNDGTTVIAGHTKVVGDFVLKAAKCVVDSSGQIWTTGKITATTALNVTTTALATGTLPTMMNLSSAAHTGLSNTATQEVFISLGFTKTFTGGVGAIATMYGVNISSPTYAATSAQTITKAATLTIQDAPAAGTNMTLTATYALDVRSGTSNFAGLVLTAASATGGAGLRLPHGAAPTSPVDGDMWTTSAGGLFVRINGVTKTVTLT